MMVKATSEFKSNQFNSPLAINGERKMLNLKSAVSKS